MATAVSIRSDHPDWLISCALHRPLGLDSAAGIDAFVVSPVFPAGGRSAAKPQLGLTVFNELISALPCPAYGLGGISSANVGQLLDTKACGIAGIDAIQKAFSG